MHPTEAGLTRATTATSWGGPTPAAATANQRRAERAYLHKRQPHPSGQMLGFFPIVLASGLVINDCRLMKGKTCLVITHDLRSIADVLRTGVGAPAIWPVQAALQSYAAEVAAMTKNAA